MSQWSSTFRSFSFASITEAVKNVESSIERAIGIPEDAVFPGSESEPNGHAGDAVAALPTSVSLPVASTADHGWDQGWEADEEHHGEQEQERDAADAGSSGTGGAWSTAAPTAGTKPSARKNPATRRPTLSQGGSRLSSTALPVSQSAPSIVRAEAAAATATAEDDDAATDADDAAPVEHSPIDADAPTTAASIEEPAVLLQPSIPYNDEPTTATAAPTTSDEPIAATDEPSNVALQPSTEHAQPATDPAPVAADLDSTQQQQPEPAAVVVEQPTPEQQLQPVAPSSTSLARSPSNPSLEASHLNGTTSPTAGATAAAASSGDAPNETPSSGTVHSWQQQLIALNRKIQEQAAVIAQRETQLETINVSLAQSRSDTESLESQVENLNKIIRTSEQRAEAAEQRLKAAQSKRDDETSTLRNEFSERLGAMEKKLLAVTKERDKLRESNAVTAAGDGNSSQVLAEKEQQVKELLEEGEKLQKRLLQYEGLLKKLRQKSKTDETELQSMRDRLSTTENLLETKAERLKQLEQEERSLNETVTNMKQISETTAKKLDERTRALDSAQAQVTELQLALEKAWKEVAEHKKISSGVDSKAEMRLLETQQQLKIEHEEEIRKLTQDSTDRERALQQTIRELRSQVSRQEDRYAWREDELRKEIQEMQVRCQAAEQRNEELAASVAEATKPLLRQIEVLQQSHATRQAVWDSVESSLNARVSEEEERASVAQQRERDALSEVTRLTAMFKKLEAQSAADRAAISRLNTELETARAIGEDATRARQEAEVSLSSLRAKYEALVESSAESERSLREALDKANAAAERLSDELQQVQHKMEQEKKAQGDQSRLFEAMNRSAARAKSELSLLPGGMLQTANYERLQQLISQRDGEVASLQVELAALEGSRKALEDELVRSSTRAEEQTSKLTELEQLREQYKQLERRHNTALELMGEKDEQLEDLRADFNDLKQLYRAQVSDLLAQLEKQHQQGK